MLNAAVLDITGSTIGGNGRAAPLPRDRREPRFRPSGSWALAQLATAALLLLTLGGVYVAFVAPHLPGRGVPVVIPALSDNPAEFVWQTKGGPDRPLPLGASLAVDPRGNLWATDGPNSSFQIFAPDGKFLEVWGASGSAEGQFDFVLPAVGYFGGAATFDALGNLYVVDTGNHRVQKFGPDRGFLLAWGSEGAGDGEFLHPHDVAVGAGGNVYVIDVARSDIQVFDGEGRFLFKFADEGSAEGQLRFPGGLTVDSLGNVWVADSGNDRVQQFAADGTFLVAWGVVGPGDRQPGVPSDVAVDEQGRVYVANFEYDQMQIYTGDGRFLSAWGKSGTNVLEVFSPFSVALDGAGNIYVSGYHEPRVQKFRLGPPLAL